MRDTTVQNEAGWLPVALDQLGVLHCGQSPASSEVNLNGEGEIYVTGPEQWHGNHVASEKWTTDPKRIAPENSIFIAVKGAGVGKMVFGRRAAIGRDVYAFEPHPSLNRKYIFWAIKQSVDEIIAKALGDIPGLSKGDIVDHVVRLPNLRTQQGVVAKIEELFSELDKAVESLTLARAQLKTYRQALLKAAFEGRLTADWRAANPDKLEPPEALLARIRAEREARYKQALADWQTALADWRAGGEAGRKPTKPPRLDWPANFDFDDLPAVPMGWTYLPFELLASAIRNGISHKPNETGALKIFRISAVRPLAFDMDDFRFIDDLEEYQDYRLRHGDLVFTRYNGSRAYVGVAAVYRGDGDHAYPDKLIRCDVASNRLDPDYLEKAVNCGAPRVFIESRIRTTAGQAGISGADLKAMPVPVCGPQEQRELNRLLDAQLSQIGHMDIEIDLALARTAALRQSILKQAFSGQLVAQNPTDEPAAALLARLRDEAPPTRTRRRKTA